MKTTNKKIKTLWLTMIAVFLLGFSVFLTVGATSCSNGKTSASQTEQPNKPNTPPTTEATPPTNSPEENNPVPSENPLKNFKFGDDRPRVFHNTPKEINNVKGSGSYFTRSYTAETYPGGLGYWTQLFGFWNSEDLVKQIPEDQLKEITVSKVEFYTMDGHRNRNELYEIIQNPNSYDKPDYKYGEKPMNVSLYTLMQGRVSELFTGISFNNKSIPFSPESKDLIQLLQVPEDSIEDRVYNLNRNSSPFICGFLRITTTYNNDIAYLYAPCGLKK